MGGGIQVLNRDFCTNINLKILLQHNYGMGGTNVQMGIFSKKFKSELLQSKLDIQVI